jgi:Arc/MetJ-type ribon-helix-helix transcriptional regulator
MAYQLPTDLETQFSLRVATGHYADLDHVLRDALSALDSRDREVAAIQEGIDALERGDVMPLEEFNRQFRAEKNIPLDA